jgi:hypothetical protein
VLEIRSHGPLILSTNFWGSPHERAGKLCVSTNAGAFRVLVPASQEGFLSDMLTAVGCAVSRGPWPAEGRTDAVEILFDDATTHPFFFLLSIDSLDRLPTAEDTAGEWVLSVWTQPRRGRPHLALQRPCRYRVVPRIPCLRPWSEP